MPEAVQESKEGRLSMDYGVIAFTSAVSLARRIQDQDKEIPEVYLKEWDSMCVCRTRLSAFNLNKRNYEEMAEEDLPPREPLR